MAADALNLLTDIAGLRVGHADDARVITGATVILVEQPSVTACVIRGGAPDQRGTASLEPEMTVQGVDAIVLSGGSSFGLDATGGVLAHLREQGIGLRIGAATIPIVAQAITFDLLNGGDKAWGRNPPYWDLGLRAAQAADGGVFPLGSVGGGMGATTANLKGGLGSASAVTSGGHTVAALAVVNAVGSVTIGDGPHFWAGALEQGCEFGGVGLPAVVAAEALALRIKGGAPPSTTIAVVATDAVLTKAQAKRMAIMADDGLARAVRPAHAPMDGDTVFSIATLRKPLRESHPDLTEIGMLAGDCLARAIARGVYEARIPAAHYSGPACYRDRFGQQGSPA